MSLDDDWFAKLSDEHFVEVGRAVTEWGELESLIYRYLEKYISSIDLYNFLTKQVRNFDARCDLLLHLVTSKVKDESRVRGLDNALKAAKSLTGRHRCTVVLSIKEE